MKTSEKRLELKDWYFMTDQVGYGDRGGYASPDFDHSGWTKVEAYTSWNSYDPAMADYENICWFYTEFEAFDCPEKKLLLHFDGIGGTAVIFVNGERAGANLNRYLPFEIDMTPYIRCGAKNSVAVKVDNRPGDCSHLPGGTSFTTKKTVVEWVLHGGLTHHVYVVEKEPVSVEKLWIKAGHDGSARIEIVVHNASKEYFSGNLSFSFPELPETACRLTVELPAGNSQTFIRNVKAEKAEPWSPETPRLYAFEAVLSENGAAILKVSERIGFRTVEVKGTKILLNGKKYFLKGANRYDEYEPYGICAPAEKIREDLLKMKEAGLNLVRTHYPQDEIHYELADELGLMYMIEVPLNWWRPFAGETIEDHRNLQWEAEDAMHNTFRYFCNHPCWTIWSVSNECEHSNSVCQEVFRRLADLMRVYDSGRLITCVIYRPVLDSKELDFCDFLALNYYPSQLFNRTEERRADLADTFRKDYEHTQALYPDVPHVITEFGVCSINGMHGDPDECRFTEDFAVRYLEDMEAELSRNPNLNGLVIWSWADYRHRRGFVPGNPANTIFFDSTYGPYGVVTDDRKEKKIVFDALKRIMSGH